MDQRQIRWEEALQRLREPDTGFWGAGPVVFQGIAEEFIATGPDRFEVMREAAESLSRDERLYGGFAFDDERCGRPWQGFPAARFILPEREWRLDGDAVTTHENPMRGGAQPTPSTEPLEGDPVTDMRGWSDAVATALSAIHAGDATKLVLARCRRAAAADPVDMVLRLMAAEPDTNPFLFRHGDRAFYGATPETLVDVQDDVRTHALAGTAPTGADWLIDSPKDLLEHELVVTYLRGRLDKMGATRIDQGRRGVRRLRHVQHLETSIRADVPGRHILDLVEALHPTPAVCGLPPNQSRRLLRRLEPFHRGWYTGAVGWFDGRGRGRFDVALRAALSTTESTWLFAGAGIVSGSKPENEWDETTHKLQTFEELLSP